MPPTKLLMVISSLGGGGAERQFLETVNRLDRDKFDVSVCLTCREGVYFEELDASRVSNLICLHKQNRWDLFRLAKELRGLIKRVQPDIVHAWLYYSRFLASLATCGIDVPIVAGVRNSLRSHDDGTFTARAFRKWSSPFVNGSADVILANSQRVADELIDHGYDQSRVEFIPNGIDYAGIRKGRVDESANGSENPHLLAVGRLANQKGYSYLLEAMRGVVRNYPDASLSIAGRGPLEDTLKEKTASLGIEDNVEWLGFRDDVYDLMAGADVFVLSSLYEGMPNVVMEAMALEKPIVATGVDGVNELVTDGETGVLVPPGDSAALRRGIETLLEDRALARQLGRAAAQEAENYDFRHIVPRFERLYERVVS